VSAKARPDLSGSGGGNPRPAAPADTADPIDGLTAAQAKAVPAVAHEPTMARAAELAGVSVRTLQRWQRDPVFHTAVLRARKDAYSQAVGVSQKYAAMAVATFVKVMNEPGAPASAKVAAGSALLKVAKEGIELDNFGARLEGLERAARGEVTPAAGRPPGAQPERPPMRLVKPEEEPGQPEDA
jgi:hypothetical protein